MARESLLLCEAAGFDVVLIECTGTMQSLAAITDVVDCHLALMPSSLDDASTASGEAILETADIVVVNSLDETRDSRLMQDTETYQRILSMRQSDTSWSPPVLACNTLSEGGLDELWQQVRLHRRQMIDTGEFIERRERQNAQWC